MALVKRDTDYALRALTQLAVAGDFQPVSALAEGQEVPPDFLRKIMQRLHRAGIVESSRGPFGGYRLARPARQVTILDIMEAVQGGPVMSECIANPRICDRIKQCPFRRKFVALQDELAAKLAGLRLSDAVKELQAHERKRK